MVPAGAVESVLGELRPLLSPGDIVIDGGNSRYVDSIRRGESLAAAGIEFVDVGTSGGIWGLEQGFCLMIGRKPQTVRLLDPIFRALAPGRDAAPPTSASTAGSTIDEGYLHCGPIGAGHYVKMVHNGIEYGLMAAYAEGMNLLHHARGPAQGLVDSEIGEIAELWRRGSVVRSWLLDLAARALQSDPSLAGFEGHVADSGEGRWTIHAGVEAGVPPATGSGSSTGAPVARSIESWSPVRAISARSSATIAARRAGSRGARSVVSPGSCAAS